MESINEDIVSAAASLTKLGKRLSAFSPALALDLTWPSVGVLDFVAYAYRSISSANTDTERTIFAFASYLAGMTFDCWRHYGEGLRITLNASDSASPDVILAARGGPLLPSGAQYRLNVSETMRLLLFSEPQEVKTLGAAGYGVDRQSNLLSPAAIGMLVGASYYGEGAWKDPDLKLFSPALHQAEGYLSRSAARYYGRVFPYEPTGAKVSAYFANLVLPPLYFEEPFPALRGTSNLCASLKADGLGLEQISAVALNLASSPDELISCVGFCISAALSSPIPHRRLLAIAQAKGISVRKLRPATLAARKALTNTTDWISALRAGDSATSKQLLEVEQRLGLAPYVYVLDELVMLENLLPAIEELMWLDPLSLLQSQKQELIAKQSPAQFFLLKAVLALELSEVKLAKDFLKRARDEVDAGGYLNPAALLYVEGLCAISDEDFGAAVMLLNASLSKSPDASPWFIDIVNALGFSFQRLGRWSEANEANQVALGRCHFSTAARIQQLALLHAAGDENQERERLEELARFAFMDRRVFTLLFAIVERDLDF